MNQIFIAVGSTASNIRDIFGTISKTPGTPDIPAGQAGALTALVKILNVGLNLVLIVAGLYTLLNFILAGFKYITSHGDPKATLEANQRMTYTVVGLIIIAIAPLLAAVLGIVLFGRYDAIINPDIKTVNDL